MWVLVGIYKIHRIEFVTDVIESPTPSASLFIVLGYVFVNGPSISALVLIVVTNLLYDLKTAIYLTLVFSSVK